MSYATGEWGIGTSPSVFITVRSKVWSYLTAEMNPRDDYLVLSWSGTDWLAGILPREFPGTPPNALRARLDQYTVLVVHPERLDTLQGRTLQYEANRLSII